jgi:hypothetical protein
MLAPGNYRAFEIVGDSMLPTPSGSVIVAEKIDGLENVKSNLTYIVVSRNEGIVYKRVMKNNKLKNKLTLISDNTVFQPYTVNTEDILEIWKAEMVVSKANTEQRWDVNQLASLVSNLQDQNQNEPKIKKTDEFLIYNRKDLLFCIGINHSYSGKTAESREDSVFFAKIKTGKTKGLPAGTLNPDTGMHMSGKKI